jgi:hypothetical protein
MDQQQAPRSGQPKARRRRHAAEGARSLVLAASVATVTGITAGMVLHATSSPASASSTAAGASSSVPAARADEGGGDDDGPRAAAVASTTPLRSAVPSRAIAVPSTSSRGS